jgi:hypothetical protein
MEDGEISCFWWLRTPGNNPLCASVVIPEGKTNSDNISADTKFPFIRPVIWLDMSAEQK